MIIFDRAFLMAMRLYFMQNDMRLNNWNQNNIFVAKQWEHMEIWAQTVALK